MYGQPPRVSVIIRNFNRAHCISRALDSACAQTYPEFDIIVVDDASTDNSTDVLHSYDNELVPLSIVELTENVGAGQAANVGVAAATGTYVAFLDSDDAWHPQFLEHMVAALEATPRAALAFCDFVEVWEPYGQVRVMRCRLPENQREGMLTGGFIHTMSMTIMRKAAFEFVDPFEPRYSVSHDFMMWLNLALELRDPFIHVARPLTWHYRSADGVTTHHDRWLDEYREALVNGYKHPAAAGYEHLKETAIHNVALGIVARRQTGRWLAQTSGAFVSVIVLAPAGPLEDLQRALASVANQSYRNFEIVVVDNAGDDAQEQWLAEGDLERWAHVRLDERYGVGGTVNLGATAASGELLTFLNASDTWDPEYLANQVRANSYVSGAALYSITDARLETAGGPRTWVHDAVPMDSEPAVHLIRHPVTSLSVVACRRDRFLQTRGVNDILVDGEALDLLLRLKSLRERDTGELVLGRAPAVHVPRALVTMRRRAAQPASAAKADRELNYRTVLNSFIDDADPSLKLLRDSLETALMEAVEQYYE